tara:strand:- start:89 stop:610 length:522 start_codon:yes stop_codon:yes gene_type:complete
MNKPNKQLILLRHAKSDWSQARPDHQRPLNARGQRQSLLVGKWLAENALNPDCIISSDALRCRETIMQICRSIDFEPENINWEPSLYHAGHREMLSVSLNYLKKHDRLMLVAHNPGLDSLLEYLCPNEQLQYSAGGKLISTSALAQLEIPADLEVNSPHTARLLKLLRPAELE